MADHRSSDPDERGELDERHDRSPTHRRSIELDEYVYDERADHDRRARRHHGLASDLDDFPWWWRLVVWFLRAVQR